MKIAFLVPAYNEAATIGQVLEQIDALGVERQIVVVDAGSTDDTAALVRAYAEQHAGVTVIQDADLEYNPAEVPHLIEPIEQGVADVVYGSRLSGGRAQRAYLFW